MKTKTKNLDAENFYDKNQILYNLFWSKNDIHYGLWEKDTKSLTEAVLNTNIAVSNYLQITKKDKVLDAGCGTGGTSIFIAEKYGTKVTGITLSDIQIEIAKQNALKSKAVNLVDFFKQDVTQTKFEDNSFSKIFGIESICYVPNKIDFFNEAFRLMKKDGRIVIVDAFLIRTNLNRKEKRIYDIFLKGWALPMLSTKDSFCNDLEKAGFKNIRFYDKQKAVKKSSGRIYILGLIAYPFTSFLSSIRIVSKNMHGTAVSAINQKKLLDKKIITYGIFVAEK